MQSHDHPQGITTNTISLLIGHPDPTTLTAPHGDKLLNSLQ